MPKLLNDYLMHSNIPHIRIEYRKSFGSEMIAGY